VTSLPDTVFATWTDLWRFPQLVVELTVGPADPGRREEALLKDYADPPADCAAAVRKLVRAGEFSAAERLRESLPDPARDDVEAELTAARDLAAADVERRCELLEARAGRLPLGPPVPEGLAPWDGQRRAEAEKLLGDFEDDVEKLETAQRDKLIAQVNSLYPAGRHADWRGRVVQLVRADEFALAERLIADGPTIDQAADPQLVPRVYAWPYHDQPVAAVVSWYSQPRNAPPTFTERWLPGADDAEAHTLATSVDGFHAAPGAASAAALATAIDALVGATGLAHEVEVFADGYLTILRGLHDARLVPLDLPSEYRLWLPAGLAPPPAGPGPQIVYTTAEAPVSGAAVARLTAPGLYALLTATFGGVPATRENRRINLLRLLYAQVDLADVWTPNPLRRVSRETLVWFADMLGLRLDAGGADVLMYDTGGHPLAVRALLRSLCAAGPRPRMVSGDTALARHTDPDVQQDVADAVLAPLDETRDVAAICYAALDAYGSGEPFDLEDLIGYLGLLVRELEPDGVSAEDGLSPVGDLLPVAPLMPAVLDTGLVRFAGGRYRTCDLGLVTVLRATGVDFHRRSLDLLGDLRQRMLTTRQSERLTSTTDLLGELRHMINNDEFVTGTLFDALAETDDPERKTALIDHARQLNQDRRQTYEHLLARSQQDQEVTWDPLDIVDYLTTRARVHENGVVTVRVVDRGAAGTRVVADELTLRTALDNLLLNALQALEGQGTGSRRIRLTTYVRARHFVLDLEDSGPGIPPEHRGQLWRDGYQFTTRSERGGSGQGLKSARANLRRLMGDLVLMDGNSVDLGGAHFRITLPCHRADPPPA
jgi:signal transduction histidine kinase